MAVIYDLTDTWNNAGISWNGVKLNVTDSASAAGSKLLDLQIGGASKFTVGKTGTVTATGLIESTTGGFRFPDGTTQTTASAGNVGTVTSVTGAGSVSGLTLTGNVTSSGSLTLGGTLSLTSGNVTSALGFTPYNATNPAGYTTNVGTVTSVSGAGTVSGLTLTGSITGSGSLTLGGTLSLTSGNVTTALGYTPYNATNPAGYITSSALSPYLTSATAATTYQPLDGDLTAIAALAGTVGLIRKTAANTYSLDTDTYLTGITSSQVTTALGYTPYNATNPSGYLSTVSLTTNVTGTLPVANGGTGATTAAGALTSLGAYPASNPSGYTSNTGTVTGVTGTAPIASSGGTAPVISIDAATTSLPGSMSAADKTKLDGIATNANNYVLPKATATTLGGVEVFDATVQTVAANAVSSTAARTYGVQLNAADQMVVNVPWTDTASGGTVTSVDLIAGTGVSVSGGPITSSGSITVTNTAPDQVVSITAGSNVVVTGSYPSFTVAVPGGGGGGGSVSSVDASGGTTGLTFSGGPITSAGILTLAGTLDLDNGGTGATTASGARTNLGAAASGANADITSMTGITGGISSPDFVQFDTTATVTPATGRLYFNDGEGGLAYTLKGGNVVQEVGQSQQVLVYNGTGATLTKGQVVYSNGAQGQRPTVALALATSDATSARTLGIVAESIANGAEGWVTSLGIIENIDTSAFTAGAQLYLSGATAGGLTATKPYAPIHMVYVARCIKSNASSGRLFVTVQIGYEMDELHDVSAQSPSNNDGLFYNTSTSLWEKKSIVTALGYTPYDSANPTGYITSSALTPYLTSATAATTYQPLDGDLTAIAALAGTSGIVRKTAADTYTLDTATYLTGITSGQVTTALGFTPYDASNPAGYTTNTGTVTGVTGTAPIVSSGGAAPAISITAATTSAAGSMSSADKTKLDGIATSANNYVLPKATATALGGVEVFDATVQTVAANAVSTTAARTYGVQLNAADQMVVNVPWVDTNSGGTVTSVGGTGTVNGITLTGTVTSSGSLTLGGTLSGVNLATQVTGTLPVANGGTGATTLAANNVLLGNGTSALQAVAPGTAGNVLTSNGTTWTSAPATGGGGGAVSYTQNIQSADYTLVLGDAGKQIFHPVSDTSRRTYTIPSNASVAFPIGTVVLFSVENNGQAVTVAITSDTLVFGNGTTGNVVIPANQTLMAIKVTATKWMANYLYQTGEKYQLPQSIAVAHDFTPFITAYPWGVSGFGAKYSNPATLPTGSGRGVAFSPAGDAMAVAHSSSPRITAYPWSGSGFGTKFANPATLPPASGTGVAFNPLGNAIAVTDVNTPEITAYPWSGSGFGTKFANPATLPTGGGNGVAFSPAGDAIAVVHPNSPRITAYPWSGSGFGTKFANPATALPWTGYGVAFNPTGDAIAVAHGESPAVTVYSWSSSGFGTKFANPTTVPSNEAYGVTFSPSGDTIAVAHFEPPYISAYPWSGSGFGTKYANPSTTPTNRGRSVAFSPGGNSIAVAHLNTPFVTAYPWSVSGFGTKFADPATLPTGDAYGVAFTINP
jgi:hypothetical protein